MNDLKPCPFCGVKGTKFINHYKIIHKENCYLAFTTIIEDQKDIKAWNTRASSWIRCEDRLPDDVEEMYNVIIETAVKRLTTYILWYSQGKWCYDNKGIPGIPIDNYHWKFQVIAWRLLPELPQGRLR